MKEITMPYSVYKKRYSQYKTVYGSYDSIEKTIIVNLPDDVEYIPWSEVKINPDNVKCSSSNATCIMLPYSSSYKNFELWVTNKLIKKCDGDLIKMIFKPNFKFKIRKGQHNKEISADELVEIFNCSMSEQEYPELHIPEELEPVHIEALEELKDVD